MPERDLALLTGAARAAGDIALRYWQRSPQVWDKAGDEGPVTEADLAVNDMLCQTLRTARPDYGWLSEETPDTPARLESEYVFIIDPIDGTRAFIAGDSSFSHSLAVARNGQVTAAAVYLPALDRLYTATFDGPALCNGELIRHSDRQLPDGATILTPKVNMAAEHWVGPVPAINRAFRASVAYRLCLIADGSFDGLISFRPTWEWDIAAGALIASRASATVSNRQNAPLHFNTRYARSNGILAAAPDLHAALVARMKY